MSLANKKTSIEGLDYDLVDCNLVLKLWILIYQSKHKFSSLFSLFHDFVPV